MKKLIIGICLLLAACGSGEREAKEGTVTNKDFNPAHEETYTERVADGQDCKTVSKKVNGKTKQVKSCKTDYDDVEKTRTVPDTYTITFEDCNKKDDCVVGTDKVSSTQYEKIEVGDHYVKD